ncbi:MAG: branched-chain amino acid ABC transporter permease [Deltaproteobacteria bacterium]|nr:branched-chain amino acid ABC transporter permease [Deltaproteobacteria bacterium]MBW2311810.1 branched-chain amino acid ABC transporter permease [Deltaproteobacteria bacterium]RLB31559.1 MAG: branched-chain amino acid ABC transporter permease [Deltaproteobacteria bacterium]
MVDSLLLSQYLIAGLVIGIIYALMAIGITFIYSIMKMINWSMGEFYMMGSYLQYFLVVYILGPHLWFVGIPISMAVIFFVGLYIQRFLLKPMFVGEMERKDEYATVITIAMMVFFRNLAVVLAGPNQFAPPDYASPTYIGPLPVSGNRFVALVGTLLILGLFYLVVRNTWVGRALRGSAQNRVGIQTAGVNVLRVDQIAFGIGVSLAAAAGALLAPIFLVWPENGAVATMKGFEIIVIGGLGSIPGSLVAGLLLGLVESMGSVLISPSFKDVYGFGLVLFLLAIRPTGLFGERQRVA